jgi:sterol desaturase/sphingolipid hydroxylase (fatty acid hydroxylase superfamily)
MDAQLRFALVLAVLHSATLLGFWGLFALMQRRGIARRFLVAEGKSPDPLLARRGAREVVVGQLLFVPLCYFLVFPLWSRMGGRMEGGFSVLGLLWQLLVFILLEDTIFYWAHRLLHTRWLFRHVHVRHHRFRHVRGFVAEYAHPLESAINFVAFFIGPILLGSPFSIVAIWIVVRMLETVEAHSGFAFSGSSSRHSFHHLHAQRGCYGSFVSPWEIALGTDRQWREWRTANRAGKRS